MLPWSLMYLINHSIALQYEYLTLSLAYSYCVGMLEDFDTSNPSKAAIMVLIMECVMHLSIVCNNMMCTGIRITIGQYL